MEHVKAGNNKPDPDPQKCGEALMMQVNFSFSHMSGKSDELLCRSLIALIGSNYACLSNFSKKCLPCYFEVKDLLPALYQLNGYLTGPRKQDRLGGAYNAKASSNQLYASCKRHPE